MRAACRTELSRGSALKSRVTLKLAIVFALTLVILLALLAVGLTISSREAYRQEAVDSIAQSYAGPQTFVGPVLAERYEQDEANSETDAKGVTTVKHTTVTETQRDFPATLTVAGTLVPSERHHGLYRVTVYELRGTLDAVFASPAHVADRRYTGDTNLQFAVSDVRGIVGMPTLTVDGAPLQLRQAGIGGATAEGLQRTVLAATLPTGPARALRVHMDFVLAGTQQLAIAPVGDLNRVELTSVWPSPLFAGRFLPRTRSVDAHGFTASWEISSLASTAQQQAGAGLLGTIDTLDVTLIQPSDPYKLSDRATKYGVLFVLLTFAGFFVFEVMKRMPIHPVQYLLVGFALALFFLLLISLSEHIPFGAAYLVGAAASIGLLTFYLSFVLHSLRRGLAFGALQTLLFAAIYGLLLSEDNALLLGSVMLFAVLATVMVVTRRVDWYGATPDAAPAGVTGQVATPLASEASTAAARQRSRATLP